MRPPKRVREYQREQTRRIIEEVLDRRTSEAADSAQEATSAPGFKTPPRVPRTLPKPPPMPPTVAQMKAGRSKSPTLRPPSSKSKAESPPVKSPAKSKAESPPVKSPTRKKAKPMPGAKAVTVIKEIEVKDVVEKM